MGHPRVRPEEVDQMYQLYQKYGTYTAVATRLHRSPSTVAKYIKAKGMKPLAMSMTKHNLEE